MIQPITTDLHFLHAVSRLTRSPPSSNSSIVRSPLLETAAYLSQITINLATVHGAKRMIVRILVEGPSCWNEEPLVRLNPAARVKV